ncbi:hypothetical protein [Corynebacterium cystitidis]|uniref:hypothetical protein n=1 Tax=Corynebacterium cystitidis TaxID=35757 RepID=UPI00211DED26|nr:hypothetical protein [Corynebacterium cystitidis]
MSDDAQSLEMILAQNKAADDFADVFAEYIKPLVPGLYEYMHDYFDVGDVDHSVHVASKTCADKNIVFPKHIIEGLRKYFPDALWCHPYAQAS